MSWVDNKDLLLRQLLLQLLLSQLAQFPVLVACAWESSFCTAYGQMVYELLIKCTPNETDMEQN